jgi:hypothetical protein
MSRRKHKQRRDLVENKIRSGKQNFPVSSGKQNCPGASGK